MRAALGNAESCVIRRFPINRDKFCAEKLLSGECQFNQLPDVVTMCAGHGVWR